MIESKIVHTPRGSLLDTWKTCREGDIDEDSQQPHQTGNRRHLTRGMKKISITPNEQLSCDDVEFGDGPLPYLIVHDTRTDT